MSLESRNKCLVTGELGLKANIGRMGQAFEGHCHGDGLIEKSPESGSGSMWAPRIPELAEMRAKLGVRGPF